MTDTLEAHEYLTVRELAELLRIKERKVYDLAASGQVPCSRATGKLLFPANEIRAWIEGAQSGGQRETVSRPAILLGSHDPLLDWAIRQSRSGIATFYDGSHDGLTRFAAGEGIAAGLHVYEPTTETWNVDAAKAVAGMMDAVLVQFARRQRGIVHRGDRSISSVRDLSGLRIAPRQRESGTAALFANLVAEAGLDPAEIALTDVARTEDDAVQAVRHGDADATFGLAGVAEIYGLDFVPLIEERFDLLVDRKAWFDTPFQQFLQFCGSPGFKSRVEATTGYDTRSLGKVVWNA